MILAFDYLISENLKSFQSFKIRKILMVYTLFASAQVGGSFFVELRVISLKPLMYLEKEINFWMKKFLMKME